MKIPWPAWVVLGDSVTSAPRPACSPAPALVISPRSPLRGMLDAIDGAPPGSIGWIGDAPVFVLDDGDKPEHVPPEQHAKPRVRIELPEVVAAKLAEAKARRVPELRAEVWAYVDGVLDAREREALAALLQRATLTATLGGPVDGEALTELVGVLAWADAALAAWPVLKAQADAATTLAELDAVAFDPSALGPAPTVTASDIAAKLRGGG